METTSLKAHILNDDRRIQALKTEKIEYEKLQDKLIDKRSEFKDFLSKFSDLLSCELKSINTIRSLDNIRIAEGLADSLSDIFTGIKASKAERNYKKIDTFIRKEIISTQDAINDLNHQIQILESNIHSYKREIALINESES